MSQSIHNALFLPESFPMRNPSTLSILLIAGLCLGTGILSSGCAADNKTTQKPQKVKSLKDFEASNFSTSKEGEFIVERYSLDGDEEPDLIKYFEEYPDPDNANVTLRRLRKKEVDVDSNGSMDIVRLYDIEGVPTKEKMDRNLTGNIDTISYFDNGNLVRKEALNEDGTRVLETRYYTEGVIMRIEKDKSSDGQVDYWEYYEVGTLDRVGVDLNADGRADTWKRR